MISFFLEKNAWQISADLSLKTTLESLEDWRYEIQISKVRNQRSNSQNRYFHWVCLPMIAEAIWEIYPWIPRHLAKIWLANTKEAIKNRYLPQVKKRNPLDRRRIITEQKWTSDLDTKEFRDFIETLLALYPFIPPPENPGDWESAMREYEKRYGKSW